MTQFYIIFKYNNYDPRLCGAGLKQPDARIRLGGALFPAVNTRAVPILFCASNLFH